MSKLIDLLASNKPDSSKANTKGIDKTPIDDVKAPFPGSKDLLKTDLSKPRGGEFGSFPGAPSGYIPPGYGPGQNAYSRKVRRR